MKGINFSVSQRSSALNELQFLSSKALALHNLRTEQVCHVPRASVAVHTYLVKASRIYELFFLVVFKMTFPITQRTYLPWLKLELDNMQAKVQIPNKMSMRAALDTQI